MNLTFVFGVPRMRRNSFQLLVSLAFIGIGLSLLPGCKKDIKDTPEETPVPVETPLVLQSIDPREGFNDQPVAVALTGKGFVNGATVYLGATAIPQVAFVSSSVLRVVIPPGQEPGDYDMKVVNPGGKESTLKAIFRMSKPQPKEIICDLENVYFDFDASSLSESARTVLQREADCLRKKGYTKLEVSGHADERGSTDYNIALGEHRAVEVKNYLTSLGLSGIVTISYGEEKPLDLSGGEAAWSKNRRAELRIVQ